MLMHHTQAYINLLHTKDGLYSMEVEELQKHKKETWEYYKMVKSVFEFREIDDKCCEECGE